MKNLSTAFSVLLVLAACCKKEDESIPVESVSLLPTVSIVVDGTYELEAVISPINAADKSLSWNSENDKVATVDQNGVVTGKAAGKAIITVTSKSHPDKSAKCEVQVVTKKAVSITITPEKPEVMEGKTLELKATVLPAEAAQSVIWSSGDKSKATIDPATGVVTGVKAGETTIIATAADGSEVKGEVKITVQSESAATITEFKLGAEKIVVSVPKPGETTTLSYAPRTIAANLAEVPVDITATEGAVIKIGEAPYTKDKKVDFTKSVTFSVTEEGKVGSKKYTLTILPYNKESNPYGIYNVAHLHDMRNALSEGFKLMDDITMPAASTGFKEISDYSTGGWLPIGNDTNPFTGSLDGAGHKIDNFFTDRTIVSVGLFGKVGAASIKNLHVNGVHGLIREYAAKGGLSNTNKFVGILAGYSEGTIENCHTSGNVYSLGRGKADTEFVVVAGGLVGYCIDGTLSHCSASGIVSASSSDNADAFAGGLAGYCDGKISDSYATGKVSSFSISTNASAAAGGLLGFCYGGDVIRCYATGEVSAISKSDNVNSGAIAGGLVGHCEKEAAIHINNCFATGEVTAACEKFYAIAGGLLGHRKANNSQVSNSYATGNITALCPAKYFHAGGLVGYNNGSTIQNCYWNRNASIKKGEDDVTPGNPDLEGTPKPLTEMQNNAFTTSLGDASVWGRDSRNNGLPYIKGVGIGK